jgi:acyl-CoA synthetase (AMP-forming)/AMP-acid ligase II
MDENSITYRQLNLQVNQLTYGLLKLGIEPGDRVGILAFNCLEYPLVVYAVAKCGAILVPLNFRYKKDELIYVLNNSNPRVLFHGPEFNGLVDEAIDELVLPVKTVAMSGEPLEGGTTLNRLIEGNSITEPYVDVDPFSPAMIMYTSGTTGFPKGTLFPHSSYLEVFEGMAIEGDLRHDDVALVSIPLFHNGGLNGMLQPAFMVGGTVVVMGKGFDPEKVLDAVTRYRITLTMWVPTQLTMLVNYPGITKWDTSSLDKIWYGSSAITPATLEASLDVFKARFYQWYGQVETGMVSVLRPEDHKDRSQCTGREMFNADLRIVDEDGNDVPQGGTGEIISAQKPLGMIGYYKMEEANKTTIRNGWIYTGDVGRVEGDGYFTIVDRLRDLIISGAENIYPKEIEDVISRHPGVFEVAVIGIPDDVYGESVCAVVVPKEGHTVEQQEIIDFCSSRLSGYKKPKRVDFIRELPKNANGKVTKNVLREPYWVGRSKRV